MKATKVDGIYDADPVMDRKARKLDSVSYLEVLKRQLKVMDSTAISLAMDNHLPVIVFNFKVKGNLRRVVCGESVGSCIKEGSDGD
jgi:uridylate kinase